MPLAKKQRFITNYQLPAPDAETFVNDVPLGNYFEALAAEKHVLYVPNILNGVLGNPGLMSDYIHPNDEGYKAIAERLEKIIKPLLPSL